MRVPSLGQEDPLEKGIATCSSILTLKPHGQRSLVGYRPWGCQKLGTTKHTRTTMRMILVSSLLAISEYSVGDMV